MAPNDLVERVIRAAAAADYYAVLGVDRRASVAEIDSARKRLQVALHPDKNKTPGAVDAYHKVGKAYATLSAPEKRKEYDKQLAREAHQRRLQGEAQRLEAQRQAAAQQMAAQAKARQAAAAAQQATATGHVLLSCRVCKNELRLTEEQSR